MDIQRRLSKMLSGTVSLLIFISVTDCAVVKRDVTRGPCTFGNFFNSDSKCVESCGPGFFGDNDSGRCLACDENCRTCEDTATKCTSCKELNYLLENSCGPSCSGKKVQGPLSQRVRLQNGGTIFEGRLEVFHDGQWGTVCDDGWNLNNARVICRELQLGDAIESVKASVFSEEYPTSVIFLDNVECTGEESNIEMCQHRGWGVHNCGHSEDVGIRCSGPDVSRLCVDSCADGYFESNGECQLCNLTCKTCSGSATRCLTCDAPYFLQGDECLPRCDVGFFGNTESRECQRCSKECLNCEYGLTGDICTSCEEGKFLQGTSCVTECEDKNSKHLPLRLVGGHNMYEGRVEVYINGEWGTVCDDSWDIHDVEVVCRQLGFGHALTAVGFAGYGPGSGPIHIDRIDCTGEEDELIHCIQATFGQNQCYHLEDAGAVCAGTGSVSASGKCVTDCGVGYFLGDEAKCQPCNADCLECEGAADRCIRCKPNRFLEGSSCVIDCNERNYGNTVTGRCESCNTDRCATCKMGDRSDICSSCSSPAHLMNDTCVLMCPDGFYGSNRQCVKGCPFGYYGDENGECSRCPDYCRTCESSSSGRFSCTSCPVDKVLESGVCVDSCSTGKKEVPLDIYGSTNLVGTTSTRLVGGRNHLEGRLEVFHAGEWGTVCNDHWRISAGRVVCSELGLGDVESLLQVGVVTSIPIADEHSMIWLDNVLCHDSAHSILECAHRDWGVHDCTHAKDVALKCSGPGYRKCVSHCPDGYYEKNNECTLCHQNCQSCSWQEDNYSCQSCKSGFHLLNQECVLDCPPGYLNTQSGRCLACTGNCATCEGDPDRCTSCPQDYYLKGAQCVESCGEAYLKLNLSSRVRLVGSNLFQGRVEVKSEGAWGTICDDNWSMEEANVICKELGLGVAVDAHSEAEFGEGDGAIFLDDMECVGTESSIFDCPHMGIGNHDCDHREDAGVTCSGPMESNKCVRQAECVNGFYQAEDRTCSKCSSSCKECLGDAETCTACKPGLFLSQNLHKCIPSCEEGFYGDSEGICRQCSPSCQDCEGNAETCSRCPSNQYLHVATHTCHDGCENGYVSRMTADVRLVGGNSPLEGRVEVKYNNEWGTVCDDGWDLSDANVVCAMLGLGSAREALPRARFGSGYGEIWLDEVTCSGNEASIMDCRLGIDRIGDHDCGHHEDAGVVCTGPDTAVQCVTECSEGYYADENRECQECSRLCKGCSSDPEVCTSCPEGMFLLEGECTERCGSGMFGHLSSGECHACHPDCLECYDGNEDNQCSKCREGLFLHGATCSSSCPDETRKVPELVSEIGISVDRVRLYGGRNDREGIVQVLHDGVWGGICNTNWDTSDAEVVCRELGLGGPVEVLSAEAFNLPVDSPTHMDEVQCVGYEYYLSTCSHKGYGNVDCDPNHRGDAAIRCSEVDVPVDHYETQKICRKENNEPCQATTCYPGVPCLNIGTSSSVCMECPPDTFGDGITCKVVASSLPEFKENSIPQNRTVEAGSPASLPCTAKGIPAPEVTAANWRRNGEPISAEELATDRIKVYSYGSLYFRQTRYEDGGVYTCTIENSQGPSTVTHTLAIEEPPKVMNVEPVVGLLNEQVTLQCTPRGSPEPEVTWEKDGVPISGGGRFVLHQGDNFHTNNLLTIRTVSLSDEGKYTCVSVNALGNYYADIPLTVQEPPTFTTSPTDVSAHEGETISLPCEVRGRPVPEVFWKKNGMEVSFTDPRFRLDGTSLSILQLGRNDMGTYSCIALNSVRVIESWADVIVIGPPHIQTAPSNQSAVSGETVDFECSVIGSSNPTVTWLKDNEPLKDDDRYTITEESLSIKSVEPQDAGKYTCYAENSEGVDQADAYLDVDGPLVIGVQKHIGSSFKYILPVVLLCVVVIVIIYLLWKRRNPSKAKYDLFGVKKSSAGVTFTPIYKGRPGSPSQGGSKSETKKDPDGMLESILSKSEEEDPTPLVNEGQL